MLTNLQPATGRILLSEPFLKDPKFVRSVVLIADHSAEGSVGFIVNNKSTLLLSDVITVQPKVEFPVYLGGPVEMDALFYIHRAFDRMQSGEEVGKGIYFGGNFETLSVLIENEQISESEIKFFIGYSGWSPGQLKSEINEDSWLVSDNFEADDIFSDQEKETWKKAIKGLGKRYAHLSNFPIKPNLN